MSELPALKARLKRTQSRVGLRMDNGKAITEAEVIERLAERIGLLEDMERLTVAWVDEISIQAKDFYFGFGPDLEPK